MISFHVKISMISLISSLYIKLYLNSLAYHRNIFGSSSKIFGNLWESSDIFGNFRKFSEIFRERSSGLRSNFGKFSESGRKSSESHQKRRHQYVCSKIYRGYYMPARGYEFYLLVVNSISHEFAALTREISS